jgi:hypothetical protein
MDKCIIVHGPGSLMIAVDYDDVDQDEVEKYIPHIVKALNGISWEYTRKDSGECDD